MHRCNWTQNDELMNRYHDEEWGVPLHDDRKHFEFLVLDAFQAGLSWKTILHRRENFRNAFHNFDPEIVAKYGEEDIGRLLADAGIIRNKLKINAAVTNAQQFLRLQQEYGSFDAYIWQFTGHKTLQNSWETSGHIPAKTAESDAMSKALQKEGFKFVGSTICYAYMQAAGMVNDHILPCFRYGQVNNMP
ncbi:DNA-3-methyladenine glycosylase I [Oscillatoria amoena NRMC-F 0135]|nr:DNA-3-methyladenine glycosylase I [Oscillatoria amoena NRMC-F 0135]